MQPILNRLRYSSLSYPRVWIAILLVLTFCFGATAANAAAPKTAVIISQPSVIGDLTAGGFNAGKMPSGGSFAVTPNGYIVVPTSWGNDVDFFNIATGAVTKISMGNNSGFISDSQNNLYSGPLYSHTFYKFPYLGNGSWATDTSSAADCTGNDTKACKMPNLGQATWDYNNNVDFKNSAFDASGNLYLVTATDGANGGNAIYLLTADKLYTGKPQLLYADDATHAIASIAIDPWGNLFFTDVVYSNQGNGTVTNSYVNVLPYSATTGYAASKTVLVSFTTPNPGQYDNVLSGVAVDASGTVFYSDNNGIYAFPNTPTVPYDVAHAYMVAATGGYQIMADGNGNFYSVGYDNVNKKQGVLKITLNRVTVPSSAAGTASQATDVTTILNGLDCTATVNFTVAGGNASAASATPGTCATTSFGDNPSTVTAATFPTTVALTPATPGTSVAAVRATDSANNTLSFTVTGGQIVGRQFVMVGQGGKLGDLTAGTFNAQKMPSGGGFAVTPDGYVVVGTSWGSDVDVFNLSTGAITKFTIGNNAGVTSDAQSNLYTNSLYSHTFYKLPYLGGGTWATDTSSAADCTGTDTKACKMPNVGQATWDYNNNLDFKNSAFDADGNLFLVTATDNVHGGNAIYELTADQLYTGKPVLLFTDDATHVIASIAVDPWGNVFFTDAAYTDQGNGVITDSALNVLPYSPVTGFATARTVLARATNSTPAKNGITGVAVDTNGTVYYSDNNGTFALPNHPSTPFDIARAYFVSTTGGFQVMVDKGSLYSVNNDGSKQGVFKVAMNNVTVPDSTVGVASDVTTIITALSGVDCSGSVTFAPSDANTATASAFTTGTCTTASLGDIPMTGAAWATTVSLTPAAAGPNVATLIGTDSASNAGSFVVNGYAAAGTAPQTITFDNPGTQLAGKTLTLTATTSATGLTVTLTSTTPTICTVSGMTATFITAGTCTIEATQPGDNTYAAASKVTQSFTVELQPQTITFANPGPQKVTTPLTLVATSDSGLTVSFDSTTTAVCTVSGTTATFVTPGTCTIEANQAGNTIYGAAPTVSVSFTVNGAAATPTFSPVAGTYTATQNVTISSTTPGAVIHYTTDGSVPTAASPVYSAPVKVAVTTTLQAFAIAPNYPDSAVATGTFNIVPDFTFATSSTSIAVPANGSGTATLTVDRVGGFNEAIWFACSDLPAGYACSFSPNSIMPLQSGATTTTATTTLTIAKQTSVFASLRHSSSFLATMTLSMGVCFFGLGTRRRRLQVLLLLALTIGAIAMFVGCGGNESKTPTTQPVNANITVTARAGAVAHSVTVNVSSAK